MIVIQCLGLAGIAIDPKTGPAPVGALLKGYDPDAHQGRGHVVWTKDVAQALKFGSHAEALQLALSPSKVRPKRADGQPNCPLKAFHLQFLDEAQVDVEKPI